MLITCDRPPAEFIPPVQEPYQYIIFRASEVKDLAVDEPSPRRSVHDDPAVLGVRVLSFHLFYWYWAMPCVMKYYGCKKESNDSRIRERINSCGCFRCLPSDMFILAYTTLTVMLTCSTRHQHLG